MALKISIITATFNRKNFLPRCIEGVARQSYPLKEHIIIDGGSTDGTITLLKTYAKKYPHIKWISEKDNGISSALNKGLAMATGDVIGVNGDDDFYEPGAFEIVATEFQKNTSVGVISGNCQHIRNDGTCFLTSKAAFTNRRDLIEYWRDWASTSFLPAPSTFFRKNVVDLVGGFDEADRYAMDYHHWIKITEKFDVKLVDKVLANFRDDEGTITHSQKQKQLAEAYAISKRYWGSKSSFSYYRMAYSYYEYHKLSPLLHSFMARARNSFKYRLGRLLNGSNRTKPDS
jgi:glycosyltransferase involved in cell wall biosynthesis